MKVEALRRYARTLATVVIIGVPGAISSTGSDNSVVAGQHAVLVDNIGTYGRKISTTSPLAQKFFDQGLRLVYGYYFPEAIASFEEAQQYDPDHPMLDWGLALAMGPNPNSRKNSFPDDPYGDGRKAIASARAHLANATQAERALIESLSVQYDADRYPDRAVRDEKYIEATRSVLDRYPDDLEAGFMYVDALMIRGAWNYWRRDGSPLAGTREAATALEHLMALEPNHPGAVHLYVHLFESSAEPERALPQADRLESLMPKEGHMVHMPSHIYLRVGQYEKAIASNERSVAADHSFLSQWGDRPFPSAGTYHLSASTHPPHALDVLRYAAMLQGNYARALQAARDLAGSHSMMAANPRQQRLPAVWLVHRAFGKWQALLAEPPPPADREYLNGAWHYFRGSAFTGLGEIKKAESELEALATTSRDPSLKDVLSGANSAGPILAMLHRALSGEIAKARGQRDEAVLAFEQAVRMQDALNFNEPPDWPHSMRLSLGAALLETGRAKDAEGVYREELRDLRDNGWALFGLWQSVRAQGRSAEAAEIRERFDRAWKNADVVLSSPVFPIRAVGTDGPALTTQQQEVLKVSEAWLDAFNHRNLEMLARYVADDFIGSTDDGIFMTKARLLKRLATHQPEQEQRSDLRDVRVHVDGDLAVVNYLVTVTEGGFQPKALSFQFRRTEFLQRKNGTWLAVAAHESQLPSNHRVPIRIDPKILKDYVGQYTFRPGFPATYTVESGHLIDEWKGEKTEALPMAKDTFFEREDLGWTTFVRDKQGRVTGYVYHYADGQQATGKKLK